MTIYILSEDHTQTAKWLDDKSLDKMIKELSQVLCNVHYLTIWHYDVEGRKNTLNIPLTLTKGIPKWEQWARECRANYLWLVDLSNALIGEYLYRFQEYENMRAHNKCKKIDKYHDAVIWARDNVPNLPFKPIDIKSENVIRDIYGNYTTPLPIIMPNKYKVYGQGDEYDVGGSILVYTYRNYYQATLIKKYKKIKEDAMRIVEDYVAVKQFNYLWTRRHRPEWINLEEV